MGPLHFLWLSEMWNVKFQSWQQCVLAVIHLYTTDFVSKASFPRWIVSIFPGLVLQYSPPKHWYSLSPTFVDFLHLPKCVTLYMRN